MKHKIAAALLVGLSLSLAAPAFAFECPRHMKAIDAKISQAQLSPEKAQKVKQLRDEGERLHKAGKHAESVKVLKEAEALLAS